MKKYIFSFLIIIFLFFSVISVRDAFATFSSTADVHNSNGTSLDNPLGKDVKTPQILIGKIITAVMGVVGSIALLMFIYGGLVWMTSSGNQESVKKGRNIILWSAVGLIVVFMSYALTRFVLNTIASK